MVERVDEAVPKTGRHLLERAICDSRAGGGRCGEPPAGRSKTRRSPCMRSLAWKGRAPTCGGCRRGREGVGAWARGGARSPRAASGVGPCPPASLARAQANLPRAGLERACGRFSAGPLGRRSRFRRGRSLVQNAGGRAARTRIRALKTRFARGMQPKGDTPLHLEQNRATSVQKEQDFGPRRDISVRNEQSGPFLGAERSIGCKVCAK